MEAAAPAVEALVEAGLVVLKIVAAAAQWELGVLGGGDDQASPAAVAGVVTVAVAAVPGRAGPGRERQGRGGARGVGGDAPVG